MAIQLVGSPGALFNVLGKLGAVVADTNSSQSILNNALTDQTAGVLGQLGNFPILSAQIGNNYLSLLKSLEQPCSLMQSLAQGIINTLVFLDQPQLNQTLTSPNLSASINYVLQQMATQAATVLQMTVGASTNAFIGIGTGQLNVSLRRPFDGRFLENAFQEMLTFTCTGDSYIGGATAFNEQFFVNGEGAENDVFAYDWPLGSNGSATINAIDGDTSTGSGNILTNSGFDQWTSNVPNNWTLNVGTAGVNVIQNSSIVYSVGSSLQIAGDSSTLTNLSQALPSLSPQSQYSVNVFLRRSGGAPAAGILAIDLVDSNGVVVNDQAGTPNSYSINLTGSSTSWVAYSGFFRTPENTPSGLSIRIHLTTGLSSGTSIYLDKLSMGAATQLYVQGPFVAIHSGNIPFVQSPVPDYATAQVTNSRGSGGTLATFQTLWFRLISLAAQFEILLPSSLTPTISDGLIS